MNNKYLKLFNCALELRKDFFKDENTTAFRVFNSTADGITDLTIDYFDGFYLITWFNSSIYQNQTPIINALKKTRNYKGIYQKKKFNSNDKDIDNISDFLCGTQAPSPLIIKENGVNFAVHLDDGAMTGIFLDQKDVRKRIKEKYSNVNSMLNTFSYTGAFSVVSALGGAKNTTSVDLANRSLPKTQEQFKVNNINLVNQNIIVQDVFDYFKYAIKNKIKFDLVVVDPPSFARSKKRTFSVAKDYTTLLKDVIQITSKNGVIVASTNYSKLSMREFKDFINTAFSSLNIQYEIEELYTLPDDFHVISKESKDNYLKVAFIRKF